MRKRGTSGFERWIESSPSIRKRSWPDMACLILTARRVTSKRLDVTSATSTLAWQPHRRRWNFTRRCSHCTRTGSIQDRSGRLQKLQNRPRTQDRASTRSNDAKCGLACHTIVKTKDYVFTEYAKG